MNPGTTIIINLLGGVALLLWGVRMVRTGVTRGWGEQLRLFLEHRLNSRLSAFAAGAAATTVLGSGTATGLIVSNIAASGGLSLVLGIAVLLGADVGSAFATTVFASGASVAKSLSPLLVFAGYIIFSFSRENRPHSAGRILIGVGLMLIALQLISQSTRPLNDASLFHDVLTALGGEPVLAFIVGAVLAWAFHSTLAAILVVGSLASNNSLAMESAAAFVLGINLGGGLPALLGSMSLPISARRLPVANLLARGVVCLAALPCIPWITQAQTAFGLPGLSASLALHLGINLVVGLVWLPLTSLVAAVTRRLMPDEPGIIDPLAVPRYISQSSTNPAAALANAVLETGRMSEVLEHMFSTALEAMQGNSLEKLKELRLLDQRLNRYHTDIQTFLAGLAERTVEPEDGRRALEIVLYVSNLEHAGDIVQLNLGDRIKAKVREGHDFNAAEAVALSSLCDMIRDNIRHATAVLSSRDVAAAQALIAQKDAFRALENKVIREHFSRKSGDRGKALRRSALFVDLIRDLHRLNSHVVAAGYPIVDAAGLLRSSRLRAKAKT
ncbi:MAG: Na/Pi cotransporter family protein [Phyllobacteriaceae bacterium]|nr:Na/Pi cotransporter family protein [Phyllobacteriaceae bacterium]